MRVIVSLHPLKLHLWPLVNCVLLCLLTVLCLGLDPAGLSTVCLANIANILSWHYLWDPYGGFGHDGRRIQPALPSLPSAIAKILPVWDNFRTFVHFQDI